MTWYGEGGGCCTQISWHAQPDSLPSSILATWPAHLNLLDLITLTLLGEQYKLWSSSLWSLPHNTSSYLLDSNIRLMILFSNTLSLHSSLNVRHRVSQPYSKTGNIIVFFLINFKILREESWRKIKKNNYSFAIISMSSYFHVLSFPSSKPICNIGPNAG